MHPQTDTRRSRPAHSRRRRGADAHTDFLRVIDDRPITRQQPQAPAPGSITGNVVGLERISHRGRESDAFLDLQGPKQEVISGDDGQYSFSAIPPGPFQLTIAAASFATRTFSGTLHPGEVVLLPPIALSVASNVTRVVVRPPEEQAKVELKAEEKQRVLGVIPNFYVTYVPNAAPLSPKQKFQLAWKSTLDPVNIVLTGATAGIGAGRQSVRRIRTRRGGIRKAFWRRLRRFHLQHVPRRRPISVSLQTRSAIFLQGNGRHSCAVWLRPGERRNLQGRQWSLANELLISSRRLGRERHLQYLLSCEESRGWIDVRECRHRCGRKRSRRTFCRNS